MAESMNGIVLKSLSFVSMGVAQEGWKMIRQRLLRREGSFLTSSVRGPGKSFFVSRELIFNKISIRFFLPILNFPGTWLIPRFLHFFPVRGPSVRKTQHATAKPEASKIIPAQQYTQIEQHSSTYRDSEKVVTFFTVTLHFEHFYF